MPTGRVHRAPQQSRAGDSTGHTGAGPHYLALGCSQSLTMEAAWGQKGEQGGQRVGGAGRWTDKQQGWVGCRVGSGSGGGEWLSFQPPPPRQQARAPRQGALRLLPVTQPRKSCSAQLRPEMKAQGRGAGAIYSTPCKHWGWAPSGVSGAALQGTTDPQQTSQRTENTCGLALAGSSPQASGKVSGAGRAGQRKRPNVNTHSTWSQTCSHFPVHLGACGEGGL